MIEAILASRHLTNQGPFLNRLEAEIARYLDVPHVSLVANATLGGVMVMRLLDVAGGEVITTPYSFIATTHAIKLAGAEPVFADVDPTTLNLDPAAVERRATPRTRAIVAVHSYGVPCDLAGLRAVADRLGVPLVYDAAHAMGVRVEGRSLASHGDFSVLSFHATKVFSTIEGGAVVARSAEDKRALDRLANHGIVDEATVASIGLNAKMHEISAAFGLAMLPKLGAAIAARAAVAERYWAGLHNVPGLRCVCPVDRPGHNFYAFPILVGPDYPLSRDGLRDRLLAAGIHARRYFHPLISDQPMYRGLPSAQPEELPIAAEAARRVLCLPLYPDLEPAEQRRVIDLIGAA